MIHPGYENRDLRLVYTVVQDRCLGPERGKLEELQVACTSQWLIVDLEATILDKFRALLTCVEREVEF